MKYKNLKQLTLQLFAEGDGTGDSGGGDPAAGQNGDGGTAPKTFDEILTDGKHKEEFDRRIQQAVSTAVTDAQRKWQALTDDKLTEAEKLAKMTKEEKAEYRAKKLEKEISDLKRQNALSDMAKTARKMLSDEEISIPDELLTHLVAEDAEQTKTAVDSFSKLFKEAVQEAVKDALKGTPPKTGTGGNATVTKEQIYAIKNPAERQRMIAENITLFQ